MSTWNYRVIEFLEPGTDEPWQAIHEVHYDDDGRPEYYSEDPAVVVSHDAGNNRADLCWVLDMMRLALDKPVLVEKDFERSNAELCGERSESERVTVRPGGRKG